MEEILKNLTIRCKQLGHNVPLSYCLKMNVKLPCPEIINCWEQKIKISQYISKNYTEDDIKNIFSKDYRPKIEKLIDIVNKHNTGNKNSIQ